MSSEFRPTAPSAETVFYRSYSRRKVDGSRESFEEAMNRAIDGIAEVGKLDEADTELIRKQALEQHAFPSGRAFWVAGSQWSKDPTNFYGYYNCSSVHIQDLKAFGLLMDMAMQGTGTGAVLEQDTIAKLPVVRNRIEIIEVLPLGDKGGNPVTNVLDRGDHCVLQVGDSRQGWVDAYQGMINSAFSEEQFEGDTIRVVLDLSQVRPAGERLKGFGGTANPIKLEEMFRKVAALLSSCYGRKLSSVEACLLIDEAAACVVAGNIRRCLPEDALVHTERGLVPIKDVTVGDRVQTPLGFRRVTAKFDQGEQEVLELSTNSLPMRATAKHRVAVYKDAKGGYEWKQVSDLEPEDRLLHANSILPGKISELPADNTGDRSTMSRAKTMVIPVLDADIAWLIGYTHGNGYVCLGTNKHDKPYGSVTWAMNASQPGLSERLHNRITRAVAKFGLDVTQAKIDTENTLVTRCQAIRFAEYMHQHIKQPKTTIVVPNFILEGSSEIRASYLAGIVDSDGAINNRPPHLVTTIYRSFARQLGAVLSSLSIPGRLSVSVPKEEGWSAKYNVTIPAFKGRYNQIIAPHSEKGPLKEGLKMHGFSLPNTLMRETYSYSEMRDMGFNAARNTVTNVERYMEHVDADIDVPVTYKGVSSIDVVKTYDIEVEEAHCFYCDGYLTHNSAGMRQGSSTDQEFIHAKEGLYTQDEEGNWKVDPTKEALRMANHTVCYHTKPTLEEVRASVQKQFFSGEGAIQYVPEAIARANVDLLQSPAAKDKFIRVYENQGKQAAKQYLQLQAQLQDQELDERELEHRITRYGLNPCLTPETQVMTRSGYAQIKDLVGKTVEIYDGQEWRTIDNFRVTGYDQDVYDVELHDGSIITATAYHTFILEDGTRKELRELEIGDTLKIANIPAVSGTVSAKGGYLKGFLIGDGTSDKGQGAICKVYAPKAMCVERLVRAQEEIGTSSNKKEPGLTPAGYLRNLGVMSEDMNPWCHRHKQEFPYETLNWTTATKAEFLAGLFDADGTAMDTKNGYAYQITSVSRPFLEGLLTLLRTLGIYGKIGPARDKGYQDFGPERGGVCRVKPTYRVTIAQAASVKLAQLCDFERLKSFADRMPKYNIHPKNNRVKSVTFSHTAPEVYCCTVEGSHAFTLANQIVIGQCAEVVMRDNLCNLAEVHLNTINPQDTQAQYDAFYAAGIQVAALLKHKFVHERIQYSREIDPIVGVSFTGLFDFFVTAFGANWLEWMFNDRPEGAIYRFEERERQYLEAWKQAAYDGVKYYCDKHKVRMPNRWTVVQPAGSKSLLTGASSGWHPPYAQRFIRRITLGVQDPLVSALRDWGYSLVPAPSARDDEGNLLNDIGDPRVREVLVEIPTEVPWANIPGADSYDLNQLSAIAQMRLYMNVQRHYSTHTTSATISFRENEIDALAKEIHDAIGTGYIGVALLARFDANATFPRLPMEPISKERYQELMGAVEAWRLPGDEDLGFLGVLAKYDRADYELVTEAACTSAACIARAEKDEQEGKA